MNDLEMYRESLALCDDKIIDALVERSKIVEKGIWYADFTAAAGGKTGLETGRKAE